MAAVVVQSRSVESSTAAAALAFSSNVTANNAILVGVASYNNATTVAVTASPTNTFTKDVHSPASPTDIIADIFSTPQATGGATTITGTASGGGASQASIAIYEVSGLSTSSIFDKGAVGSSTSATTAHSTATSAALAQSGEFLLAVDTHTGSAGGTPTMSGTGTWTLGTTQTSIAFLPIGTAYQRTTSTAGHTVTFTWDNGAYADALGAYKEPAGAASDIPVPLRGLIYSTLVRM